MLTVILCAIVFIGTYALLVTIRDMVAHREEIRNAPVRHKATCEVDEMPKVVKEFLNVK